MANQKQDGSNLIHAEYTSGFCKTHCEECFCNWGNYGMMSLGRIAEGEQHFETQAKAQAAADTHFSATGERLAVFPTVDRQKQAVWAIPSKSERENFAWALEEGRRTGLWGPFETQPRGETRPGYDALLVKKLDKHGAVLTNMPARGGQEPWLLDPTSGAHKARRTNDIFDDGDPLRVFLRVSSMTDSSWAPPDWLAQVRKAWGDYCFFNSAITAMSRAIQTRSDWEATFAEYHKLVVTLNPGSQHLLPFEERVDRPRDRKLRAGWFVVKENKKNIAGTMGPAKDHAMDFFHPVTVSALAKLRGKPIEALEANVKWYRLRGLPTIMPHIETDRPVVVTKMRFKSEAHIREFARRYDLICEKRKVTLEGRNKTQYTLRTKPGDPRNASPHAGEPTTFESLASWFRPLDYFEDAKYVCDRVSGSCASCGLCCTLDGTQPQNVNWLNVMPQGILSRLAALPKAERARLGKPILKGPQGPVWNPEAIGYVATFLPARGGTMEYFQAVLHYLGFARTPQEVRLVASYQSKKEKPIWVQNPENPAPVDRALEALEACMLYHEKEMYFAEGWNTYADAAMALAFAMWSLMCHAKRGGKDLAWVMTLAESAAPSLPLWDDADIMGMWSGESPWLEEFGGLC